MPAKRKAGTKKQSKKVRISRASPMTGQGAYRRKSNVRGKGAYTYNEKRYRGPFDWAGKKLGEWSGWGDYVVSGAEPTPTVLAPDPPRMMRDGNGIVITHREYLGDLISSSTPGAFKIQTFGLNPSDMNTFPWLSQVCQPNFQQYRFEQLAFEFRTFSADALNSTNTALGAVFACINYDYSDPDVTSRQQVENTDWSNSCKPSESMIIPVECDPKQTGLNSGLLYIINGNSVPSGADPKTYYLGKFFIGSTGLQAASVNIGSIYISYRVRIYKPVMTAPLSNGLFASLTRTSCDNTNLLGTATVSKTTNQYACDSIGLSFTGTVITINHTRLQVGQKFVITMGWRGNSTASVAYPAPSYSSGIVGEAVFTGNTTALQSAPNGAATSAWCVLNLAFVVYNASSDQTITFTGGNLPTGASLDILFIQMCGIPEEQIGIYDP